MLRTEFSWTGSPGTGAVITRSLQEFPGLRFEVVEEPTRHSDGSRWSHTPELGLHHAWISAAGDVVLNEDRVRAALTHHDPAALRAQLEHALGTAWDEDLESYRTAGEGAEIRWLHRAG